MTRPEPMVTLDEARARVGRTMHVDPENWAWDPAEIRWLADQWRLTLPLTPLTADRQPVGLALWWGLEWWALDSPRILRVMTAFAVLFCFGFGWGWFTA